MLLTQTDTDFYREKVRQHPDLFGYLVTPRKYGVASFISKEIAPWAVDNDCFNNQFNAKRFIEFLKKLQDFNKNCLFVTAPDVVADRKGTLKRFPRWHDSIRRLGFPVAIVLQDGMTNLDIPWESIDAVFVGGSTEWKLSQDVIGLLLRAGELGIWRHVGRVNSFKRVSHFWDFADSFDGTGFAIAPDQKIRSFLPFMRARQRQRRLL